MSWSRETKWRQGCILSPQSFDSLELSDTCETTFALAITHDCDIANENQEVEPFVEFVLARLVKTRDGNNEFAKNPRLLHLQARLEGEPVTIELIASRKISIPKCVLAKHEPDERVILERQQRAILQDWLAARYKRQALPDSFNVRFKPLVEFLEKQGKKHASGVIGYWLDYEPRDIELPTEQPYELWLYIVYSIEDRAFEGTARAIATELKEKFFKLMSKTSDNGNLDLRDCEAYSEEEFTLKDLRSNLQYRLEYLSHRTDPPGPVV